MGRGQTYQSCPDGRIGLRSGHESTASLSLGLERHIAALKLVQPRGELSHQLQGSPGEAGRRQGQQRGTPALAGRRTVKLALVPACPSLPRSLSFSPKSIIKCSLSKAP